MSTPTAVITVVAAVLAGAVFGSFAGVVRSRGWRGALRGRSRCEGCLRELRWYELVPLASYALQRGRCLSCGVPIGRAALLAEMAGAAGGGILALAVVLPLAK
jgi:leader peptidase (prepilin peptidase)/N-methyltransferase